MSEFHTNSSPGLLTAERIALVGKLASMSRSEAEQVIASHGGVLQPRGDALTTLVIHADDRRHADVLGELASEIAERVATGQAMVIDETQLWRRVGLVDGDTGVSRLYTPALLAEMVDVDTRTIHRWHRRGYLQPTTQVRKLPYFDFSEVRVARRLASLVHAGVSLPAIDRQLAELTRLAPDVARPMADLSIVVEGGKIFLRRGQDLTEPSGQLLIDFDAPAEHSETPAIANPSTNYETSEGAPHPEDLRRAALDLADEGLLRESLALWRGVLLTGEGTAEDHFAVADLLYQLEELPAARERYFMAIELDDNYDEARINLGCVLLELGDAAMAADAFRGALRENPQLADAHYHLASTLDRLGQRDEAHSHWESFVALAPDSPWAEEAHERLGE